MKKTQQPNTKVCYVLSYKDPEYIRSRTLTSLIGGLEDIKLYNASNVHKGFVRYVETLIRLIYVRLVHHPDLYVLGFRGQEIIWLVRIITIGRPLVFDEFINLNDWLINEHSRIKRNSLMDRAVKTYMKTAVKSCRLILSDTALGAQFAKEYYDLPDERVGYLYVGTDEGLFKPVARDKKNKSALFNVFFYGSILPLHGIEHILEAAKLLSHQENIKLTLVGGNKNQEHNINEFIRKNKLKNITYKRWIEFENLPEAIAEADICLGGPFGNTSQAKRVITGKTFQFLAMSKPVIVGKIGEQAGFKDKQNCLLAEQGSGKSIAEAVNWCYKNQTELESIGKAGKELYDTRFSLEAQKEKVRKLFLGLN